MTYNLHSLVVCGWLLGGRPRPQLVTRSLGAGSLWRLLLLLLLLLLLMSRCGVCVVGRVLGKPRPESPEGLEESLHFLLVENVDGRGDARQQECQDAEGGGDVMIIVAADLVLFVLC